jgi:hypothetical protein
MRCLTDKQTVDFISGFLEDEKAAAAAVHVEACRPCSARLRNLADIREGLVALPGEFEDKALCGEIMTLIDLGRGEKERLPAMGRLSGRRLWMPWAAAAAAAVAAVAAAVIFISVIAFRFAHQPDRASSMEDPEHFASRGAAPSDDQWVLVTLFERHEVNGESVYQPVGETVSANAALAAAYEDRSASPFPYLMVFAVDPTGEVFWYYPEYAENEEDRLSIAASKAKGRTAFPDEVTHEFSEGPLRFFGIFSRSPLRAGQIEETVKRQLGAAGDLSALTRIDIDKTGQWTKTVQVVPEGK